MAKWKLVRQLYGNEEFTLSEGDEVTIGRGKMNTISLTSIVVSRDHCVISAHNSNVIIRDLKSSNGVYVGRIKIPQNTPFVVNNLDIIGLGWSVGTQLAEINDEEKYVFKLVKEPSKNVKPIVQKIIELDKIEQNGASLLNNRPILGIKAEPGLSLKRKLEDNVKVEDIKKEVIENHSHCPFVTIEEDIINITDSENENSNPDSTNKKPKLAPVTDKIEKLENDKAIKTGHIKVERDCLDFDPLDMKQEYLGYDDEPLQVDSDSDSESDQWFIRLSQSSPGKPFTKAVRDSKDNSRIENSSYSQMEDFVQTSGLDVEEQFDDDIIIMSPPLPGSKEQLPSHSAKDQLPDLSSKDQQAHSLQSRPRGNSTDIQQIQSNNVTSSNTCDPVSIVPNQYFGDFVDGLPVIKESSVKDPEPSSPVMERKAQLITPQMHSPRGISNYVENINKIRQMSLKSKSKDRKNKPTSKKCELSYSQKEERKRKLKEIASKGKKEDESIKSNSSLKTGSSRSNTIVKLSSSNRGAFLTSGEEAVVLETTEKPRRSKSRSRDKVKDVSSKIATKVVNNEKILVMLDEVEKHSDKRKESKKKTVMLEEVGKDSDNREESKKKVCMPSTQIIQSSSNKLDNITELLNNLKPPVGGTIIASKTSVSAMKKKSVRFSETGPKVHVFEIEPGNKMKKTSLIRTTLLDIQQKPVFSLEKITLMKILRWNPHWLEEQINNKEPPPILGHNKTPMSIFHSFANHNQYVQLIGDLLLMEIWECFTIAYDKIRSNNDYIQMRIDCLPPVPTQDHYFELFNLSVNVSLPTAAAKMVPRVGDVLLVTFGPENDRNQRFFFVHNVHCLPSPANNVHSFFSISLHATFTEKMRSLRPGEVMFGRTLAGIRKDLSLFEAIEYLAGSPLSELILKPEPHLFPKYNIDPNILKSQWTMMLNPSQQLAVSSSVSAALSDRPCVQMVQGPPGTGKSSVICAIVMTYFYDALGKRQQNRGKILICATSNAAVDELVIRLLNIRQSLPKSERFRMVRVGRAEAMHPRARDVSSQQLAARDVAQAPGHPAHPAHPSVAVEIVHLEAKINMWKAAAQDAKDPVRVAYCQGRVADYARKVALVRGGAGGGAGGGCVAQAERRIVEGADIVISTLASIYNHKMRGLKRRIALCIVDEAGQAIEPETLIPLTLDVTRLTLIGDPQQLPGYICSQRAKKHGLSESLFARLASCGGSEPWAAGGPAVLLDRQYRMQPAIADYPVRAFYGGRVSSHAPARPDLPLQPYTLVAVSSGEKGQGASGANEMEAWGVARLAAGLAARLRARALSLAVITPYNGHKDLIKTCLRSLQHPTRSEGGEGAECVEVNTVDSFQGQERDVVVVSLARSQGVGFLTDAGRMNVMLTRARHALVVCLNPHAMMKSPQWRTLVEDAMRRHVYTELPNRMCLPLTPSQMLNDDIVDYIINASY